jgi:hypothetical protein
MAYDPDHIIFPGEYLIMDIQEKETKNMKGEHYAETVQ